MFHQLQLILQSLNISELCIYWLFSKAVTLTSGPRNWSVNYEVQTAYHHYHNFNYHCRESSPWAPSATTCTIVPARLAVPFFCFDLVTWRVSPNVSPPIRSLPSYNIMCLPNEHIFCRHHTQVKSAVVFTKSLNSQSGIFLHAWCSSRCLHTDKNNIHLLRGWANHSP